MRFREPVSTQEVLDLIRPLLLNGNPGGRGDNIKAETSPLWGPLPPALSALASPESSDSESLTFAGARLSLRVAESLRAALILAEPGAPVPAGTPVVAVASIHAAMAALLAGLAGRFARPEPFGPGPGNEVAPTAVVEGCLEGEVTVGAGAYVGKGTFVGRGTRIGPNAVVLENCRVGRDCVIQSGAVIGCAGFGFFASAAASAAAEPAAMPHPAGVEIGDRCWIGAHTVVAAGVLHPTLLGPGCKLDSHVQIAHNVRLGEGSLLASQSGIAGSTTVGRHFRMGGNASVDGHLVLGDHVTVAACSGVTKSLPDHAVVAGFPARPIAEWRREKIRLRRGDGKVGGDADPG